MTSTPKSTEHRAPFQRQLPFVLGVLVLLAFTPGCFLLPDRDPGIQHVCDSRFETCPPYSVARNYTAGNWTLVTRAPAESTVQLAATDYGIALVHGGHSLSDTESVPSRLYFWRGPSAPFEQIADLGPYSGSEGTTYFVALTSQEDTVFIFLADLRLGGSGSLIVKRYHPSDGTITTDPVPVGDDRAQFFIPSGVSAIAVGNLIHLFGGCCTSPYLWTYDTTTMELHKITELPRDVTENPEAKPLENLPLTWHEEKIVFWTHSYTRGDQVLVSFDPKTGVWTQPARFEKHGGFLLPYHGTLWSVGSACVTRLDTERSRFVGSYGTGQYDGSVPTIRAATQWSGKNYLYDDSGLVFEWTPPEDPLSWPTDAPDRVCGFASQQS
jgi:hypothetical protein